MMIASSGVPGGDVLRLSRRALPNSPIGSLLAGGLFAAFFVGGDFVLDGIAGSSLLASVKGVNRDFPDERPIPPS